MNGAEVIKKAYYAILRSDFEQAIAWFEKAIELEPDNPAYHYKLSITCARSSRLAKALEHAEKAVKLTPGDRSFELHFNRLKAQEKLNQAQGAFEQNGNQLYLAVALLKESIALDPLSVEAFMMLGMAYAGLEEYPEAIQALKEALKLNPQHAAAAQLVDEYKKRIGSMLSGSKDSN
jgi:tetratricopeptide (TPR) repeat protein